MTFELPKLTYGLNDLEPSISLKTMEYHYGKHHQAYVTNLNNLIKGTVFESMSLEEIVKKADGGIFNNGAQVWNHTFYFSQFNAKGSKEPEGKLLDVIKNTFGSFDDFKLEFTKAAISLFGSGWVWLVKISDKALEIIPGKNADNPLRNSLKPVLTCDVWEHAYYLDYQNKRPDYISAFWNIIDWKKIEERF